MDEFIKFLDNDLKYLTHNIIEDTVSIYFTNTGEKGENHY